MSIEIIIKTEIEKHIEDMTTIKGLIQDGDKGGEI